MKYHFLITLVLVISSCKKDQSLDNQINQTDNVSIGEDVTIRFGNIDSNFRVLDLTEHLDTNSFDATTTLNLYLDQYTRLMTIRQFHGDSNTQLEEIRTRSIELTSPPSQVKIATSSIDFVRYSSTSWIVTQGCSSWDSLASVTEFSNFNFVRSQDDSVNEISDDARYPTFFNNSEEVVASDPNLYLRERNTYFDNFFYMDFLNVSYIPITCSDTAFSSYNILHDFLPNWPLNENKFLLFYVEDNYEPYERKYGWVELSINSDIDITIHKVVIQK